MSRRCIAGGNGWVDGYFCFFILMMNIWLTATRFTSCHFYCMENKYFEVIFMRSSGAITGIFPFKLWLSGNGRALFLLIVRGGKGAKAGLVLHFHGTLAGFHRRGESGYQKARRTNRCATLTVYLVVKNNPPGAYICAHLHELSWASQLKGGGETRHWITDYYTF